MVLVSCLDIYTFILKFLNYSDHCSREFTIPLPGTACTVLATQKDFLIQKMSFNHLPQKSLNVLNPVKVKSHGNIQRFSSYLTVHTDTDTDTHTHINTGFAKCLFYYQYYPVSCKCYSDLLKSSAVMNQIL